MQASSTTLDRRLDQLRAELVRRHDAELHDGRDIEIASGESFTTQDVTDHARKVVLGPTVPQNLFSGTDPGRPDDPRQRHQLHGRRRHRRARAPTARTDQDDVVLAPLTAVQDTLSGYGSLSSITVQATSAATLDAAQAEVESILYERKTSPTRRTRASP